MTLHLPYADAYGTAKGLNAALGLRTKLYMLPYQWRRGEASDMWWLAPTPEKRAFPYGKLIFSTRDEPAGTVFCGHHVERGFGAPVDERDMRLTDRWVWHRFARELADRFPAVLGEVEEEAGTPPVIHVSAPPYATDAEADFVTFSAGRSGLAVTDSRLTTDLLIPTSRSTTIGDLAGNLSALPPDKIGWYWVDVLVGIECQLGAGGSDDTSACAEAMAGFEPWLGKA